MNIYKDKSKCTCGKRAKYRVIKVNGNMYACEEHKERLNNIKQDKEDNTDYTDADYATWLKV